jgi:beta-aspartyl-peptidase (threonine type)
MGKLTFSDLEIHVLAPDAAWVGGRWQLDMQDGKKPGGLFTLIFRKLPEGWKIVHDHTS